MGGETGDPPIAAVTTASGVTTSYGYLAIGGSYAYPPAASFYDGDAYAFNFEVTGDPVGAATPEPATFGLFGGAILLFGFARKRLL